MFDKLVAEISKLRTEGMKADVDAEVSFDYKSTAFLFALIAVVIIIFFAAKSQSQSTKS